MFITLIGYRGTGKTTIGSLLAQRLNWKFADLDSEIERRAGMTVSDIFQKHGEPHFRLMETDALQLALSQPASVISPGGGIVLDVLNRVAMKQAGPVIWLSAPVEIIVERLQNDPASAQLRPSLTGGKDPFTEVQSVLTSRLPLYEDAASHIVETHNRTPESLVDEIMRLLPEGTTRSTFVQ